MLKLSEKRLNLASTPNMADRRLRQSYHFFLVNLKKIII